jgi:hypothetical protein
MKRAITPAVLVLLATLLIATPAHAVGAATVVDRFGRVVNDYGVKLVDWEGYLANPYIELTVRPPAGARFR